MDAAHDIAEPAQATQEAVLHAIEGNPVPAGARPGFLTARDGLRLRYALFTPERRPAAGTVVILAGRNECIEKYFETIGDLSRRGLGVAIMDWRGQGGSERMLRDPEKGHVESFADYVGDLDDFFSDIVLPDCPGPFFILGHSMGGLVALLAAPGLSNRVSRMVLSAPLLALADKRLSMRSLTRVASLLYNLGLGSLYLGGGRRPAEPAPFAGNHLTSDGERYRRNTRLYRIHRHLALGGPTASWLRAACLAIDRVFDPGFAERINVPLLMIAAGTDAVVCNRAIERMAGQLRVGDVLTIDGARHELLQEADLYREQFWAAFDAFIPGDGTAGA